MSLDLSTNEDNGNFSVVIAGRREIVDFLSPQSPIPYVIADLFRNLGDTTLKVIPRTGQTRDCGTSPQ